MPVAVEDVGTTRFEAIVTTHAFRWLGVDEDADEGHCTCGAVVYNEEQELAHIDQAVIAELWSPTARVVDTANDLAALPPRSAILARPGRDNAVFRRLDLEDPTLQAWGNAVGTFRTVSALLPAVVLELGPDKVGAASVEKRSETAQLGEPQ